MIRFLLTRRWLGLLAAVLVVSAVCVELGLWQFHRYSARHERNTVTRANLHDPPVSVSRVMQVGEAPAAADEWRQVEATGTYDADRTVVVLYQTRDGAPGVDVVTPLVTADGTALLVDRGWVETAANGNSRPELPPTPAGTVRVTGWVRVDAEEDAAVTDAADGSVRAISAEAIGETLPYPTYGGFVDLTDEDPATEPAPQRAEEPDLSSGPHFFYGVQWWFFAALALGFWCYFARTEYVARRAALLSPRTDDGTARTASPASAEISSRG